MRNFDVMKNRLTNGEYFSKLAAEERINALANELKITQDEAETLHRLAVENGDKGVTIEDRLIALEKASLEHDVALMELADLIAGGVQ